MSFQEFQSQWQQKKNALLAIRLCKQISKKGLELPEKILTGKVAFIGSFTLNDIRDTFKISSLFDAEIDTKTFVGEYNQYAQELLNTESALFQFGPEMIFLLLEGHAVLGEAYDAGTETPQEMKAIADSCCSLFEQLAQAFQQQGCGQLVIHTIPEPCWDAWGIQANSLGSVTWACRYINNRLRELAGENATQSRRKLDSLKKTTSSASTTDVTVTELSDFSELPTEPWDNFYWTTIAPTHMGPAREAKYLQWRFGDIPIFKYRILAAKHDGKTIGLLVFRVEQVRGRCEKVIRIVDFVANADAADALAQAAAEKGMQERAVLVDFFCTHKRYNDALEKVGFIDATTNKGQDYWFPYLFQPMDFGYTKLNCAWWLRDMDLKTPHARDDMALMKGDYEFDRPN